MNIKSKSPSTSNPSFETDQTEWLLEFVNLGKKAGVLNCPTVEAVEGIKRKPDFSRLEWRPWPFRRKSDYLFAYDAKGKNWWKKSVPEIGPEGPPTFAGKSPEPFPEKEFWQLISKKGLPFNVPQKKMRALKGEMREGIESDQIALVWVWTRDCFFQLIANETLYLLGDPDLREFRQSLSGISKTFWACFEILYIDYARQEKKKLRLCTYCGRFFLAGGKKKFCDPLCAKSYSIPSKTHKALLERSAWKQRRRRKKEEDYKKILAYLKSGTGTQTEVKYGLGYTEKDAEKEARLLIEEGYTYERVLKKYGDNLEGIHPD